MDVSGSVTKARDYARNNPSKVLGGLAMAVIGAGLLSRRRRHATVRP
jgi:MYXO-CTERM domain-containing protein